jgi:GntR family transcriptional regulator of arabinose operon
MTDKDDSTLRATGEYFDRLPAYEKIKVKLVQQIEARILRPGDRLPSENELCQMFGVSRITAVRALTELAQAGIVVRKQGLGTFVAEISRTARNGSPMTKPAVGLLLKQLSAPFDLRIVKGVEYVLSESGYDVVLYSSRRSEDRELELLAELGINPTCGVIALPMWKSASIAAFQRFCQSGKPLVLIDMQVEGINCDIVTEDNVRGGYDLTAYLLQHGHRDIAFVPSLDLGASTTQDRYQGYRQAHESYSIPVRDELYARSGCERTMTLGEITQALSPVFQADPPPTAVLCTNYSTAAAVDLYLSEHPACQAALTFFDSYDAYSLSSHPVARMIQFPEQMSAEAAKLLLDRIEGRRTDPEPVRIVLPQKLVTYR